MDSLSQVVSRVLPLQVSCRDSGPPAGAQPGLMLEAMVVEAEGSAVARAQGLALQKTCASSCARRSGTRRRSRSNAAYRARNCGCRNCWSVRPAHGRTGR